MDSKPGFWARVNKTAAGGCWEWTSTAKTRPDRYGYGLYSTRINGRRVQLVHRIAWELLRGPIPAGMQLDHLCRNRLCVNPDHLEPVTNRENTLRGTSPAARNALKTHCKHGHQLTPENIRDRGGLNGRECRECIRRRRRDYKRRTREGKAA
jgi:hypothetical protein